MNNSKLSNQPPKGTADWFPKEFAIRKYIFDTWRKVCLNFGFEEYLSPIVESAEVYRAKSGEDVGGSELMSFFDRGERELAIRPEMTPSVTRMITQVYENSPKPLRYFSIANFFRNEKPQKGRNREFWQLNADIFGTDSLNADIEIISMSIEIMRSFGAQKEQFIVLFNDRRIILEILKKYLKVVEDEKIKVAMRILDKFWKLSKDDFITKLQTEAGAQMIDPDEFIEFMKGNEASYNAVLSKYVSEDLFNQLKEFGSKMDALGYEGYGKFDPSLVRGFDYYDGIIFEVFDYRLYLKRKGIATQEPSVERSLFGGGRYNGLASIFGANSFPAVGFAPGDETTKIFLESWGLIPENLKAEVYYLPLLSDALAIEVMNLAQKLRSEGKNVIQGLELQKFGKAFEYANKIQADYVVIFGEDEKSRGEYQIKDMKSGEQNSVSF